MADEIDYRLIGDDLQAVIVTLDPNEMVIAEAGAMMYMEDGIVMQTTLDPNATGSGLMGKLLMGAKRALTGDSFFITTFGNMAAKRQDVAFASPYPEDHAGRSQEVGRPHHRAERRVPLRGARRQRDDRLHTPARRRLLRR